MILGSLGFIDSWKLPALIAHPLQAMAKFLSWNLQVLSDGDDFCTLSPSTPITNILCIHAILNLPGFTGLCHCTELFLGVESSHFFARPPASPRAREASSSSTRKPGFHLVLGCLSSHPPGRVSHALSELEQGLIHSSYNTSLILFTCLPPQHDAELLGTRLCFSSPPLAPSPVHGTFTKTFWSQEKFLWVSYPIFRESVD